MDSTEASCTSNTGRRKWLTVVDDIVLIIAPNKSTPHWQMRLIIELLYGKDGKALMSGSYGGGLRYYTSLRPLELSVLPD